MKTIQYLNFAPPEMTEALGRLQFEEIFEKVPSDAYVAASAEKQSENRFRAVLECHAMDLVFLVEAVGCNSFECVQRLCDQAKEKISQWRDHRFDGMEVAS